MKSEKTAHIVQAKSVKEFLQFVHENADNLVPADSFSERYRGVKTKDGLIMMILPISVMFDERERVGERTRRLLTSATGQLIKDACA